MFLHKKRASKKTLPEKPNGRKPHPHHGWILWMWFLTVENVGWSVRSPSLPRWGKRYGSYGSERPWRLGRWIPWGVECSFLKNGIGVKMGKTKNMRESLKYTGFSILDDLGWFVLPIYLKGLGVFYSIGRLLKDKLETPNLILINLHSDVSICFIYLHPL